MRLIILLLLLMSRDLIFSLFSYGKKVARLDFIQPLQSFREHPLKAVFFSGPYVEMFHGVQLFYFITSVIRRRHGFPFRTIRKSISVLLNIL